jgi:hypothetical protein
VTAAGCRARQSPARAFCRRVPRGGNAARGTNLAPADRIVQKIAERGHVSATRVHNVPRESFERQVESDNPPNSRAKARSPGFYS